MSTLQREPDEQIQILDEEGEVREGATVPDLADEELVEMYREMRLARQFDQWAISVPRERQTASETIAQKADAYGFDGVQVDGNDPIAVKHAVGKGIEKVREGEPVLIESLTYRQGAHSTSDDPSRYEHTQADLPDWRTADPVERFETYLRAGGVLDDERVETIEAEAEAELDEAVEIVENTEPPGPEGLFDSVFEEPTPPLRDQQEWLEHWVAEHGHPDADS